MDFRLVDKLLGSTCVLVFSEYLKKGGASFEKGAQEMKTSLKWKVYKKWIILITLISIILLVIIGKSCDIEYSIVIY